MPLCSFVMDAETGKTCGWYALKGKDMCYNHHPDARAQHLASCSLGGKVHNIKGPRLRKPDDILKVIEQLVADALGNREAPAAHGQAALRACDLALKALDAGEWTDRMAALETKLTEEEKRRARAIRDAAEAQDWGDPEPRVFPPPSPDDKPWVHRGPGKWVQGEWVYTGETAGTQQGGTQINAESSHDSPGCGSGLPPATDVTVDSEGNAESPHDSPGCRSGRTEQASCAVPATDVSGDGSRAQKGAPTPIPAGETAAAPATDVPGGGPRVWVAPQPDNTVITPPAAGMYDIPLATYTARRKARAGLLPPWPHLLTGPYE